MLRASRTLLRRLLVLFVVAATWGAGPVAATPQAPEQPAVAATPPMGWNSWNTFGCDINEELIKQTVDAIVASGMREAGYEYVVLDDCWYDPQRDADGNLRANPERFPSGMEALGDYIHSKGLKFGIYQSPTEKTCAQRTGTYPGATGSAGHEYQDARRFAEWGVDYLKYDWCSPKGDLQDQIAAFTRMRDALRATGRPIVYSINANSYHAEKTGASHDWSGIANLWRTTADIKPVWETGENNDYPMGIVDIIDVNAGLADQAGPGHFNDPDMLEVGVYDVEGFAGLNDVEARAHFGMWALMAAPLMAGNDVRDMPAEIREILTNPEVIAVDQDPAANQAKRVIDRGDREIWVKDLADGSRAVGLFNRSEHPARVGVAVEKLGLPETSSYRVRDLFEHVDYTAGDVVWSDVPAHGLALFRVSPKK